MKYVSYFIRKKISTNTLARHIYDLACIAEVNFKICVKLYEFINFQKRGAYHDFFLLTANNAFHESVGIIHTLLCSTQDEEVRIKPLLEEIIIKEQNSLPNIDAAKIVLFLKMIERDYFHGIQPWTYTFLQKDDSRLIGDIMLDIRKINRVKNGLTDLELIREGFEKASFHKIRHQAVAHKNKYLAEPAYSASCLIYPQFRQELGEIVKKLRINCSLWFDYTFINSYESTLKSLEMVIAQTVASSKS